jgi:hypothetical protein
MDAARRLRRPGKLADPLHDRFHQPDIARRERPGVRGLAQVGQDAPVRVPFGPAPRRRPWRIVQRQAGDEARPRRAEAVRPGSVHARQLAPESARRLRRGWTGRNPRQDERAGVPAEHPGNRYGPRSGQPAEPPRLGLECWALVTVGDLGERRAPVGQGGREVLPPVLRPRASHLANFGPGKTRDPCGNGRNLHDRGLRRGHGR